MKKCNKNILEIPGNFINESSRNNRNRLHYNYHGSFNDNLQKILISLNRRSYIRPHRHRIDPKEEILICLSGDFAIVFFSNNGKIVDIQRIKPVSASNNSYGIVIQPDQWHMVVSISPNSLILEIKQGPFISEISKEFANWAPEENSDSAQIYLNEILIKINNYEKSIF